MVKFEVSSGVLSPIGSMVLLYMVTWIPSIYPIHVGINIPAPWIRVGLLTIEITIGISQKSQF